MDSGSYWHDTSLGTVGGYREHVPWLSSLSETSQYGHVSHAGLSTSHPFFPLVVRRFRFAFSRRASAIFSTRWATASAFSAAFSPPARPADSRDSGDAAANPTGRGAGENLTPRARARIAWYAHADSVTPAVAASDSTADAVSGSSETRSFLRLGGIGPFRFVAQLKNGHHPRPVV